MTLHKQCCFYFLTSVWFQCCFIRFYLFYVIPLTRSYSVLLYQCRLWPVKFSKFLTFIFFRNYLLKRNSCIKMKFVITNMLKLLVFFTVISILVITLLVSSPSIFNSTSIIFTNFLLRQYQHKYYHEYRHEINEQKSM